MVLKEKQTKKAWKLQERGTCSVGITGYTMTEGSEKFKTKFFAKGNCKVGILNI